MLLGMSSTDSATYWTVTMCHDTGTALITTTAPTADEAKRLVCLAEGAPLRSAIAVRRAAGVNDWLTQYGRKDRFA
jgi:hypothetical protein